ncbi:DUF5110 domain-containing protein [Flavobacteriaceae bacterium]|nr:DUF5110 domain-containing protein [Flavobacteriaceae bacterium]
MMNRIFLLIGFLFLGQSLVAQNETYTYNGISFSGIGAHGIEVSYEKPGVEQEPSHARVIQFSPLSVIQSDTELVIRNGALEAVLNKESGSIAFSFAGMPLITERNHEFIGDNALQIDFNISQDEALYGTGERVLGMNRRGHELYNYNRAHYGYETHSELMNFTMPIVMSSNLYSIHFDNPSVAHIDLDSKNNNQLSFEAEYGAMRYQVFAAEDWYDLIDAYTDFSGKQPMIPRWALGNFSSRFGYHSQKETIETIEKFREEGIPVDAIILDLYWFGKDVQGHMGNLAFDRDSFPDPKAMIRELNNLDVKTVLITEPFVLTTSDRWEEAVENEVLGTTIEGDPFTYDFFFGNTGLIDVFSPAGQDWFWEIYKELTEMGVSGWWGDLGEPEVHPEALMHYGGKHANEVHNIFGNQWAKIIHEGYENDFPNQRSFILMRAGYSGAQRYGMIPWSGDVNRTWGGLVPQTEIALQMGMQGMGYFHSDLGGFAGANLDDELYIRWLQYGVFNPIFRPHAQEEVPSEPVFRSDKAKALAKQAIELRYALLPYNYTLAFENHHKGTPLMRPLIFEDSKDESLTSISSSYYWGESFYIKPVVEAGQKTMSVELPAHGDWFDFYTDQYIQGGSIINVKLEQNHIPTYVRSGAFIAMTPGLQSTMDYSLEDFDLHFYKGNEDSTSSFIYNDDGLSPRAYENGFYELVEFESNQENAQLLLTIKSIVGKDFEAESKSIELIIHNYEKKPNLILVNEKSIDFEYDRSKEYLKFNIILAPNSEVNININ